MSRIHELVTSKKALQVRGIGTRAARRVRDGTALPEFDRTATSRNSRQVRTELLTGSAA